MIGGGYDLLLCSGLQGVAWPLEEGQTYCLLGEVVAEELAALGGADGFPAPQRTGVLLAGGFYADRTLHRRGRQGAVRPVWHACAQAFHWVVGVAGNHDVFAETAEEVRTLEEGRAEARRFSQEPGVPVLDAGTVAVDGLRFGGVSGIMGAERKQTSRPFRREQSHFLQALRQTLARDPAVLLHQGPNDPEGRYGEEPAVRACLAGQRPLLMICGHVSWPMPLVTLHTGTQILNVDGRVLLLLSDCCYRTAIRHSNQQPTNGATFARWLSPRPLRVMRRAR